METGTFFFFLLVYQCSGIIGTLTNGGIFSNDHQRLAEKFIKKLTFLEQK
ncbi:MAG: hypothetical protein ABFC28_02165 [Rikenellaceae bacterium]